MGSPANQYFGIPNSDNSAQEARRVSKPPTSPAENPFSAVIADMADETPLGSGSSVRAIQTRLNTLGYNTGEVDGIAGPMTNQAIRAFQSEHGLVPDGIVGPLTREKLNAASTPSPVTFPDPLASILDPFGTNTTDGSYNPDLPVSVFNPAPPEDPQADADARALAANDAGDDPQHIINPRTGSGYTDAELRALVEQRAAEKQGTADARALAANEAGQDYDHIINPSSGRGYTDADVRALIAQEQETADARAVAANEAGQDYDHIINPSTGRGYTDAEVRELVGPNVAFQSDPPKPLPERVEVVHADVGGSVGPIAVRNETIYTIEYLPDGYALVTKHTEAGAGLTGSWRIGGFVNAGEIGEGGIYLGAGAQYLGQGVEGETYRVPADQAQDLVKRDALHFTRDVGTIGIGLNPGGLTGNGPSPLEAEGTLVRKFEGFERDGKVDGLAELGIHDADWLGPFENFIGGSLGGEYVTEISTTTHQDFETGNTVVRAESLDAGELDISFLELQDAKADDDPTVFGIDENPQRQRGQYVEIVSNAEGDVIEVVYGRSESNGETLARSEWTLDATDPALAERIQAAMSDRGGPTGYEGLADLAEAEGQQQTQSYDISGTNYGGGGDFFPLPDIGAGGSVNLAFENYDGAGTSTG